MICNSGITFKRVPAYYLANLRNRDEIGEQKLKRVRMFNFEDTKPAMSGREFILTAQFWQLHKLATQTKNTMT